jgi:hypothetical protein
LAIGDNGQGLEGCLGKAVLLAIEDKLFDYGAAIRVAIKAPSPIDSFERESAVFIARNESLESIDYLVDSYLKNRCQGELSNGLIDNHQDGFNGASESCGVK